VEREALVSRRTHAETPLDTPLRGYSG